MDERVDLVRGVRTGARLGLVIVVVESAITLVYVWTVSESLGTTHPLMAGFSGLFGFLLGDIVFITMVSVAIGVLYAFLYDRLPDLSSPAKAWIVLVPIWTVVTLFEFGAFTSESRSATPHQTGLVIILCLMSIPYGYLLGRIWDRQGATEW